MYRISEEVARKLIKNIKSPEIGPLDINQKNPFAPKNKHSIGFIDPYAAVGLDFDYILELGYPFINPNLPLLPVLSGYWLYRKDELTQPTEPFHVPKYLADPNVETVDDTMDVSDCSVILPSETDKLTCKSISTFERLIEMEPLILDCLNRDIK